MGDPKREELKKRLDKIKAKVEKLKKNGELYINLKKISEEAENFLENNDIDGFNAKITEAESYCKGNKKIILGVVISVFFVLSNVLYLFLRENDTLMKISIVEVNILAVISIVAVVLFNLVLIPFIFYDVLSDPKQSKMNMKYYHILHILFVVLPVILALQVIPIDKIWYMFIIPLITICNIVILYISCKKLIKKYKKCLCFSNMLMNAIFFFLITSICLFHSSLNSVLVFLFLMPFIGLQVLYEGVDLFIEDEKT